MEIKVYFKKILAFSPNITRIKCLLDFFDLAMESSKTSRQDSSRLLYVIVLVKSSKTSRQDSSRLPYVIVLVKSRKTTREGSSRLQYVRTEA
jgi:hypothetical protein